MKEEEIKLKCKTHNISSNGNFTFYGDLIKTKKQMKNTEIKLPKIVGSYEITGSSRDYQIHFNFTKKPKLINRLFCKWCLGWTWIDK